MPRATISRNFIFMLLIRFFAKYRSKKSREKPFRKISRFLMSRSIFFK